MTSFVTKTIKTIPLSLKLRLNKWEIYFTSTVLELCTYFIKILSMWYLIYLALLCWDSHIHNADDMLRRRHIVPNRVASCCDLLKSTKSCELLRSGGLTIEMHYYNDGFARYLPVNQRPSGNHIRRSHIVPDLVASCCDLLKSTISCELLRAGGLTTIITMDLRVIYR